MGLVCLVEGYDGTGVYGGRIEWDWCAWWKDTMGLFCLGKDTMGLGYVVEGYGGTGVSGGRIRWDWCVWWKDVMGLVCLVEGYDGTGVSGGGRKQFCCDNCSRNFTRRMQMNVRC